MVLATGVGAGEGMAWASKNTHALDLLHLDYIPILRGGDESTEGTPATESIASAAPDVCRPAGAERRAPEADRRHARADAAAPALATPRPAPPRPAGALVGRCHGPGAQGRPGHSGQVIFTKLRSQCLINLCLCRCACAEPDGGAQQADRRRAVTYAFQQ